MGTPTEPIAEAAGEAVQTAVMAVRLFMAVADAARRHQQRQQAGQEEDLPPTERAVPEATEMVKRLLPEDISLALTGEADWPTLAAQLVALREAGVDLHEVLPRMGEIAVNVRDQVAAKAATEAPKVPADAWVGVVREALPAGAVREAVLSSPAWPEMAVMMARLEERGVNVREVLVAAHDEVLSVNQAVAAGLGGTAEPAVSRDAKLSYGPLTEGLDLPRDLDLSDRERALSVQLAISAPDNERYVRWVREALPEREREAGLLVSDRHWPLLAARMAQMEDGGMPVREHLRALAVDPSWESGPGQLGTRLVQAASDALTRPVGALARTAVNVAAARSTSPSVDPTRAAAAKTGAPAESGVAVHREPAAAPGRGKRR
ncbi:hypothetical protein ACIPWL_31715 [Streptomyces sp. NPDC090023]|uniref:hypothetical protein n=1 Tax=unclassified Streptomyces TaxID=2593676 RepID=UPI00381519EA